MGLFDRNREAKAQQQEREQRADAVLSKVMVFPGCKADLEELLDCPLVIVDTGWREKGLTFCTGHWDAPFHVYDLETRERLAKLGIVALVHATPKTVHYIGDEAGRYGIPVARPSNQRA